MDTSPQQAAPDQGVKFIIPQRMMTPIDMKIEKGENEAEGEYAVISFVEGIVTPSGVAASQVSAFKISKEAAAELVLALTGGVHVAKANEIITP